VDSGGVAHCNPTTAAANAVALVSRAMARIATVTSGSLHYPAFAFDCLLSAAIDVKHDG